MTKPIIKMCTKTVQHLQNILKTTGLHYIRIGVTGGGCNGLKYLVTPSSDITAKGDTSVTIKGLPINICGKSLLFIIGTQINWVTDAMGSRIEFTNPNAQSSCGCGETFSV